MRTQLILVGGFLGAGKTTLLLDVAKRFASAGQRVGLITNDQAPGLVDTAFLRRSGAQVEELHGSCFCCNFDGFIDAVKQQRETYQTDVIVAEPVGSCTDLSATIIQPLKDIYDDELIISPLTVMADPFRLADILAGGTATLHPSAAYIYSKQLEEADIIAISKTDLLSADQLAALKSQLADAYPGVEIIELSGETGTGVAHWIERVTSGLPTGQKILEVDYDIYAEGEAVLGWLNISTTLSGELTDWQEFLESFLQTLSQRLEQINAGTAHIKAIIESGEEFVIGNLTGKSDTLTIRGAAKPSTEGKLTINARVEMAPDNLESVVGDVLDSLCHSERADDANAWSSLSPGYPKPTHRYKNSV